METEFERRIGDLHSLGTGALPVVSTIFMRKKIVDYFHHGYEPSSVDGRCIHCLGSWDSEKHKNKKGKWIPKKYADNYRE